MWINQKEYWLNFAQTAQKDDLCKDLHGSWDEEKQEYTNHAPIPEECVQILKSETSMTNVLDFGVGMGRNSNYLKSLYKNYLGYDTPPMLKNLTERKVLSPNEFLYKFEEIEKLKLDLVYESVVMQHMPPQEVIYVLNRISHNSPYLFSCTRSYNDYLRDFQKEKYGVNMALLRKAIDCFEPIYCSIPIEQACSLMNETEYNILYKSKNFNK